MLFDFSEPERNTARRALEISAGYGSPCSLRPANNCATSKGEASTVPSARAGTARTRAQKKSLALCGTHALARI